MPEVLCSICSGPRFLCGGCPLGVPRGLTTPLADRSFEEKLAPGEAETPPVVDSILEVRLVARLRSFISRAAPLVRDQNGTATLTIMLHQPGGDTDGTLYLEAAIKEELELDGEEGRIPGVPFGEETPW